MSTPFFPSRHLRQSSPTALSLSTSLLLTAALLLAAALLLTAPQSAIGQQRVTVPEVTLPGETYYIVTRIDPRLCPSPICGGVYVKRVNRKISRCADGTYAEECYAPIIDWTALALTQEETWKLEDEFSGKRVLARGALRMLETPYGPLPELVATDAWRGTTGNEATGYFFGLRPSGIVCITSPCPELIALRLNRRSRFLAHGLDLAVSGANASQIETGLTALYQGAGLLVSGQLARITGPAGQGVQIVAREFYTKVESDSGGICGGTDPLLPPPDVCITLYDPVCGCDGVTYSNDCVRQQAQVRRDHTGACGP